MKQNDWLKLEYEVGFTCKQVKLIIQPGGSVAATTG